MPPCAVTAESQAVLLHQRNQLFNQGKGGALALGLLTQVTDPLGHTDVLDELRRLVLCGGGGALVLQVLQTKKCGSTVCPCQQ